MWSTEYKFLIATSRIVVSLLRITLLLTDIDIQTKGFNIFGIQSFVLTKKEVGDFYEIYKGKHYFTLGSI